jgi:hypothetical protein
MPPGADSGPPPETEPTLGHELDPADLPPTLCKDGYRANLCYGPDFTAVAVSLFAHGSPVADVMAWVGGGDEESRDAAERLLPVARAACRFLNTATGGPDLTDVVAMLDGISGLPAWRLRGACYYLSRRQLADVLYRSDDGHPVRVVEDQFHETLSPLALLRWYDEMCDARDGDNVAPLPDDEPDAYFLSEG